MGYLLDDDPSLKSFPINNGLFDDDRMGALWKPTDDDPHLDEVVILDTSDPPLAVLLGRTVVSPPKPIQNLNQILTLILIPGGLLSRISVSQ